LLRVWGALLGAPRELPGDAGAQFIQQNDPSDFCAEGDRAGYSILNVSDPTIVPFIVPMDTEGRRDGAVIIAPGGGNRFLSWTKEGTEVAKWLNSIGISAFVLKYRVPTNSAETHMKTIIDAQRALSLVRYRSERYGLNKSRIGVGGFSAGAFLMGEVSEATRRAYQKTDAADEENFRPDFSLEIYGYGHMPMHAPPTFIAIAQDDPCVGPRGALAYYTGLIAASQSKLHEAFHNHKSSGC